MTNEAKTMMIDELIKKFGFEDRRVINFALECDKENNDMFLRIKYFDLMDNVSRFEEENA